MDKPKCPACGGDLFVQAVRWYQCWECSKLVPISDEDWSQRVAPLFRDVAVAIENEMWPTINDAHTLARTTDPSTSHEAARAIADDPEKRTLIQRRVLALFKDHISLTDWELVGLYQHTHGETAQSTIRTRRKELVDAGVLRDSGRIDSRRRRKAIIWELA